MLFEPAVQEIIAHCGGQERLSKIGARDFVLNHTHVSFKLIHPNPKGVRSVTISAQPDGNFEMDCFGPIPVGSLNPQRIARATGIIPENLATVLGQLTGIETLHHRHF